MAFEDRDYISKEKHELDHVLRKRGKRGTQENRDLLVAALDAFKADASLEPHRRDQFYAYAERMGLMEGLEAAKGDEAARSASPAGSAAKKKLPWWWIIVAVVLGILLVLLLRSCGGCSPAAPSAPASQTGAAPQTVASPQAAAAPRRLSLAGLPSASLAIRFLPDSSTELASGEELKLQALAAALRAFDEGELALVEHAWRIGYPEGELAVSEKRAGYVAQRLAGSGIPGGIKMASSGSGAAAPLGDAASSRRVEISAR